MLSIQSKRIEKTAKSTDEAINLALSELGATRDMVEIEILEEGAKGLFGFWAARTRMLPLRSSRPPASVARAFLDELFFSMGMKVDVAIDEGADALNINLSGDDMGIIIGKRGDTLDAVQYLTSLVVNRLDGPVYKGVD